MKLSHAAHGIALLALSASVAPLRAQSALPPASPASTGPSVSFSFDRKGLPVPTFQLVVNQDATAVYQGQEIPPSSSPGGWTSIPPQNFRHSVSISPATAAHIFALARQLKHFDVTCSTKAKNIADTGTKVLTYSGVDGSGSCTYNYSENKDVESLTDIFQGIAETMDQGRELDRLHRYDRLGLDAAMTLLTQEVSAGRALEIGTIAASLRSIADDADVMDRVRIRARALLVLASSAPR